MRRNLFISACLLFATCAAAQIGGGAFIGLRYDSNICALSDGELDELRNGKTDFLISTADDAILRMGGDISADFRIGDYRIEPGISAVAASYIRNFDKSYVWTGADCAVRRKGTRLKLSASFVPFYNSRAYTDDDSHSTQWASYWSATAKIELRQRIFWGMYIGGRYEFRRACYNDYFPEYDSDRNGFTCFAVRYNPVNIEAGYTFYSSAARGYDEARETRETSEESDISYEQDEFYLKAGRDFEFLSRKLGIGIGVDFAHRAYKSQKPYSLDPLHVGRDDWYFTIASDAKYFITENIWLKLATEFSMRKTRSVLNADIPRLRDYEKSEITIIVGRDF